MKTAIIGLVVATALAVTSSPCSAAWVVEIVSTKRAKELGMDVRSTAGAKVVQVELEFKAEGELKNADRVELRVGAGDDLTLSATLREDRSKPGVIAVRFTADPAQLGDIILQVMVPGTLGGTIYELRVKDFVPPKQAGERAQPEPKAMSRVPEPTPELYKLLYAWGETRPRTRAAFEDLEAKAEAAALRFPERDDRARIRFQVAHVVAQSDFTRQVGRYRTWAAKCLSVSRDPLQRPLLYLGLASAEEVTDTDTPFADRRRKAADWLLQGYVELLHQNLPEKQPDAPLYTVRNEIDNSLSLGEKLRRSLRDAAQREARKEYEFVRDQIGCRRMLVLHFQNFYKPAPNDPDRTSAAIDELRLLANKRMTPEQTRFLINAVLGIDDSAPK